MQLNLLKKLAAIWACVSLVGCISHDVQVHSVPQGAKVYVNGEFIGKTPCIYQDKRKAGGGTYEFKVEKEGYQTIKRTYKQKMNTEEVGLAGLFALVFCVTICCVPWSFTLPDMIAFEMEPGSGTIGEEKELAPPEKEQKPKE